MYLKFRRNIHGGKALATAAWGPELSMLAVLYAFVHEK